jgi:hypothetical protein
MSEYRPSIATELLNGVEGGADLLAWFDGQIPSFHDAEITQVVLDRINSSCLIKVHGFRMTPDLDQRGHFISIKHTIITFHFNAIAKLELADFNHQNVIDGLSLTREPNGNFLLELEPCYGLCGKVEAAHVKITHEPGTPEGVYSR